MTSRRDILLALKMLVGEALPYARLTGFEDEESPAKPDRPDPGGDVLGYAGSPGEPEVLLSPYTLYYEHEFVLEFSPPAADASDAGLAAMMQPIGRAIVADRTLGGLADWMEAGMPETSDRTSEGTVGTPWARVPVTICFSTSDPLN